MFYYGHIPLYSSQLDRIVYYFYIYCITLYYKSYRFYRIYHLHSWLSMSYIASTYQVYNVLILAYITISVSMIQGCIIIFVNYMIFYYKSY